MFGLLSIHPLAPNPGRQRRLRNAALRHAVATGLLLTFAVVTTVDGQQEEPASNPEYTDAQIEFFETRVRPVLVDNCFDCHGTDADFVEGSLSVASRELLLRGGDSGPAIVPGDPDSSPLIDAIEYGDLFQMPPDTQLSPEVIADLRQWVAEGAAWPDEEAVAGPEMEVFDLEARRDAHWCWHPVVRPDVPEAGVDWALDPIDRFIAARQAAEGIKAVGQADRRTWIRRVTFDLTGLPPTPEEIDAFVEDASNDAYEKVVDRLLDSPHFGERWARHWMDLIRYAETCGHEFDYPIPNAWQYRDYLIRAFNEDVPYDQFVVEHIAGDLLDYPRRHPEKQFNESVLGTGFWFLGEATHGPVDVRGDEAGHIDNRIDVMGKSFLGLTVACARCHDHKFDAISTEDYYALAGFLQSSRRQDVLMDFDRTIEKTFQEIQHLKREYEERVMSKRHLAVDAMALSDAELQLDLMQAAAECLTLNSSWRYREPIKLEGETLAELKVTAGEATPQPLSSGSWSGDSHVWWRGAKPGDTLRFNVDVPADGTWSIEMNLTTAPDYGIAQFLVNGEPIGEPLDLYTPELGTTGQRELARVALPQGSNELAFRLTGTHPDAKASFMLGIDFVTLAFQNRTDNADMAKLIKDLAAERNLNADWLAEWVELLASHDATHTASPLWPVRYRIDHAELSESEFDQRMDERLASLPVPVETPGDALEAAAAIGVTDKGLVDFSSWMPTGLAFQGQLQSGESVVGIDLASENLDLWMGNLAAFRVPHSGINGKKLQGFLRSPTFEITTPYIHYFVKGENARIRLIIDGYHLDEYNALLFNGVTIPVSTDGEWKWVTQGADVKNYIGHRAYIEVVDEGDGYVALASLQFSEKAEPPPHPGDMMALRLIDDASDSNATTWTKRRAKSQQSTLGLACELASLGIRSQDFELISGRPISTLGTNVFRQFDQIAWDRTTAVVEWAKQHDELVSQMRSLADSLPAPVHAIGMTEGTPENEFVFIRGNHKNLGDVAERRPLDALGTTRRWRDLELEGSGRLELARDLVSRENPLVSRVIVNRLWHHLTGRGLVRSVDNFGVLGDRPTHPELLDYLAVEFMEDGWSIKRMLRRMALSRTYRMSSVVEPEAAAIDPENKWLHAFPIRRLQGEAIRDSLLSVSGELKADLFGPPVPIHLTPFMQGRGRPGKSGPLDGAGRRSIYTEVRRNFLSPMMLAFDTPIPFNAIGKRNVSNVPAQALILLNDPFVHEQARKWAEKLVSDDTRSTNDRIEAMLIKAIGREATDAELDVIGQFIDDQADQLGLENGGTAASVELWSEVCHLVFNMKEFVYLH